MSKTKNRKRAMLSEYVKPFDALFALLDDPLMADMESTSGPQNPQYQPDTD